MQGQQQGQPGQPNQQHCHTVLTMNRAGGSEVYTVGVMGSQSHRSSRGSDTSSAYSGSDTMHSVRSSDQVSNLSHFTPSGPHVAPAGQILLANAARLLNRSAIKSDRF